MVMSLSGPADSEHLRGQALHAAVDLARRAPSLHNAQPWRWRITGTTAELYTDATREVPVADPFGREMLLGCGAALQHARVALAAAGWKVAVTRLPDTEKPDLVARLEVAGYEDPSAETTRLAAAILSRHTDRRPYARQTVDDAVLDALRGAAEDEHAHLQIVADADRLIELAVLASRAQQQQANEPGYRDELARWTGHRDDRAGVPPDAVPALVGPRHSNVPLRDFATSHPGTLQLPPTVDEEPVWCVLASDGDTAADHLRVGEALSRLLLTATDIGLASSVQSQPVEVPGVRAMIEARLLGGVGHAQALVRVGWPDPAATPLAAVPRRPLDDILAEEVAN